MPNSNSQQKGKQTVKLSQAVQQFGRVAFSLVGLICSCIFMFILLLSGYSKIFYPAIVANCQSSSGYYLTRVYVIQILAIVLDAISLALFATLFCFSIVHVFIPKNKRSLFSVAQITRNILCYVLIIVLACLFGNCVKTVISLSFSESCSSSSSTIATFSKSTQNLCLISGIALLCAVAYFFCCPIIFKENKAIYQVKSDESRVQLNLNQTNRKDQSLTIHLQPESVSKQQIKSVKKEETPVVKSRIFHKHFLSQSYFKSDNKFSKPPDFPTQSRQQLNTLNKQTKQYRQLQNRHGNNKIDGNSQQALQSQRKSKQQKSQKIQVPIEQPQIQFGKYVPISRKIQYTFGGDHSHKQDHENRITKINV